MVNDLGIDFGTEKEKAKVCGQVSSLKKDGAKSEVTLYTKRGRKDWKDTPPLSLCSLEDITSKTFTEYKVIVCK